MKKFLQSEPVRRALRTFVQSACGYIAVNIAVADLSQRSAIIGFIGAAIAAGFAAVMNIERNGGSDDAGN